MWRVSVFICVLRFFLPGVQGWLDGRLRGPISQDSVLLPPPFPECPHGEARKKDHQEA